MRLCRTSPFSAFTKSLPQEKKKPFMDLMKRLRSAKAATVGTKDEKKKAMSTLDSEIHKLLAADYKRYRSVLQAAKDMHQAKKAPPAGAASSTTAPPPPAKMVSTGTASTKKKKVMSTLPTSSKRVKSSTTVG